MCPPVSHPAPRALASRAPSTGCAGAWPALAPRRALALIAIIGGLVLAPLAHAQDAGLGPKLDGRLRAALLPDAPPVTVWVEFVDKGERGPADLAARLAAAEAALTPDARRRRLRARVTPLVDYLDLPVSDDYLRALTVLGFQPYGVSRWFNHAAVQLSGAQLAVLAAQSFVQRVTPVELAMPRVRTPLPPDAAEPAAPDAPLAPGRGARSAAAQALYGQTFTQLQRLNVIAVHDSGYIGTGINVCVLDDGFNWYRKHQTLRTIPVGAGRTRDFIRGGTSVQDTVDFPLDFQHGTTTLSTVAGRWSGVYLSPAFGCNVALARTENSASEKPIEMVYWGMGAEWADSLGCDILTSSLGYNLFPDSAGHDVTYPMLDGHTSIVTRAAEIAAAKGILVVNSAGNDGNNARVGRKLSAPGDANGDSVLAIAAVDSLGVRASFSSKGPTYDGRIKPDLAAQGVQVLLAAPTSDPNLLMRANGTSYAAPLVAGVAACLMQARPDWPPVWIIEALKRTASHASAPDTLTGWGIPDALAALRYVPDTLGVPEGVGTVRLHFAGPNPLRVSGPGAQVQLELGAGRAASRYRVRLYDATGRVVRDLAAGTLDPARTLTIPWRGDDAHGRALVPGLYFLTLDGTGRRETVRVVVLR
ncbi:MAG: S8 family serine peptidase [Candidatus Eisenbacteria bacterium]